MLTTIQRLNKLSALTDLNGNTLTVGSKVKVFDFVLYNPETDEVMGINETGVPVSYYTGVLMSIGETEYDRLCYRVRVEAYYRSVDRFRTGVTEIHKTVASGGQIEFPPLNGVASGDQITFGVFKHDEGGT